MQSTKVQHPNIFVAKKWISISSAAYRISCMKKNNWTSKVGLGSWLFQFPCTPTTPMGRQKNISFTDNNSSMVVHKTAWWVGILGRSMNWPWQMAAAPKPNENIHVPYTEGLVSKSYWVMLGYILSPLLPFVSFCFHSVLHSKTTTKQS